MTDAATPPPAAPGIPSWVAPLSAFVTQVGVPTVVAGVLLWFVLTRVDSALLNIQAQEDLRTQFVARMQTEFITAIKEQTALSVAAIEKNIETQKHLYELSRAERRALADKPVP